MKVARDKYLYRQFKAAQRLSKSLIVIHNTVYEYKLQVQVNTSSYSYRYWYMDTQCTHKSSQFNVFRTPSEYCGTVALE